MSDHVINLTSDIALKAADTSTRELVGLAVPYGIETERIDWMLGTRRLIIAEGAIVPRDDAKVFYGHDHQQNRIPIGRITASEQTPEGLRITAKLSTTPKADEVLQLARDGVLDKFSVGFKVLEYAVEEADSDSPLLKIISGDCYETSVVAFPQYPEAAIEQVLSTNPTTTPKGNPAMPAPATELDITAELTALSTAIDNVDRRVATLGAIDQAGPTAPPFPTLGHAIKALAAGDDAAVEFFSAALELDYAGGVIGDLGGWVKDSWVGDAFRFVEHNRKTLNLFTRRPLPAEGMGVEYGIAGADTTQVAEQVNEGDLLAYGKIAFSTDRAPLKTYGGWGDMSVQEIERSPFNVVEKFFRALNRRYSQVTEAVVRAKSLDAGVAIPGTDLTTADGWTKFVVEAALRLDDQGVSPEAILLGKQAFIDLALMRDGANADAPRFLDRNSGSISVTGLSGTVHNLPVHLIPGYGANDVRVVHSEAISSYEASGSPFRLTDGDITRLLKAFSIYGYLAVAVEEPGLILKPGA